MTAAPPEQATATAQPIALAVLIPRRVPAWITDPDVIQSILDGHYEIPDDLSPQEA